VLLVTYTLSYAGHTCYSLLVQLIRLSRIRGVIFFELDLTCYSYFYSTAA